MSIERLGPVHLQEHLTVVSEFCDL